jgi:hypothetical protein
MGLKYASCGIAVLAALVASCGASDETGLFGAGGSAGEGATGAGAGTAGVAGIGGVGGSTGVGGLDASSDRDRPDGIAATGGSGGNCGDYCADTDGDGHGDPNQRRTICGDPGAGWVTVCDDCHDQSAEVFPGATTCRGVPYLLPGGSTRSFDYDCSGSASECGEVVKATGSCATMGLGCSGSGYVENPENADAGGEASPYCGSTSYRVCNRISLFCTPSTETRAAVECH